MGDSMKAISEDIAEYEELCARHGKSVAMTRDAHGHLLPDCYGAHARSLKARVRPARRTKQPKKPTTLVFQSSRGDYFLKFIYSKSPITTNVSVTLTSKVIDAVSDGDSLTLGVCSVEAGLDRLRKFLTATRTADSGKIARLQRWLQKYDPEFIGDAVV